MNNKLAALYAFIWPEWPDRVNWISLKPAGNILLLRVSYFSLLLAPFLTKNGFFSQIAGVSRGDLLILYFSSIFLAAANLLFDIFCPVVIRRFESANDLYLKMLEIKDLSAKHYPRDDFQADLQHCKEKFVRDKRSNPNWGRTCRLLFYMAALGFGMVFVKRAISLFFIFWQ
ncbi:hypothetical protein [Antarctobacter jejuensis]|uniref:hypothetical protein n=1 Tax=Antarctobacter jejuensis TaxID=1439938 RepID=UPI003FD326B2